METLLNDSMDSKFTCHGGLVQRTPTSIVHCVWGVTLLEKPAHLSQVSFAGRLVHLGFAFFVPLIRQSCTTRLLPKLYEM